MDFIRKIFQLFFKLYGLGIKLDRPSKNNFFEKNGYFVGSNFNKPLTSNIEPCQHY